MYIVGTLIHSWSTLSKKKKEIQFSARLRSRSRFATGLEDKIRYNESSFTFAITVYIQDSPSHEEEKRMRAVVQRVLSASVTGLFSSLTILYVLVEEFLLQ